MLVPTAQRPSEPTSHVVAQAISALYSLDESDELYEEVYQYWQDAISADRKTEHSSALTAEEYIVSLEPQPPKPGQHRPSYSELKKKADIFEYTAKYADRIYNVGRKMKMKCILPTHEDKSASMWIYPMSQSFYCFGCREGGDIIDLIRKMGQDPYEVLL